MELVQKLIKKTSKYLFYSPLTEKVLTECPCTLYLYVFVCIVYIATYLHYVDIYSNTYGDV